MTHHIESSKIQQAIPLNFTIPAYFSQSQVVNGQIIRLIDPYTVEFQLPNPIQVDENMNIQVQQSSVCFCQPNVAAANVIPIIPDGNNRISIKFGVGALTDYFIPQGLYDVSGIQTALNQLAIQQGWITGASLTNQLFILSPLTYNQTVVLTLDPRGLPAGVSPPGGVTISFQNPGVLGFNDSMGTLLGFPTDATTYVLPAAATTPVNFTGPNVANFAIYSSYNLWCSIARDSYVNGLTGQVIIGYYVGNTDANSIIQFQATLPFKVQVAKGSYSSIRFWLTDGLGNRLPLNLFQSPTSFSLIISKNRADGSVA